MLDRTQSFATGGATLYIHRKGWFNDDRGASLEGILEVVLGHDDLGAVTTNSVYAVDRIVVHARFMKAYRDARAAGMSASQATDHATITAGSDIALVRLKRAWQGDVARLLLRPTEPKQHRWFADVYGFGLVDRVAKERRLRRYTRPNKEVYFAGTSILIRAGVPIVETPRCARRYTARYAGAAIGDGHICAGQEAGGHDSCQGDSGGPLVATYEDRAEPYQIALVSWGHGCAEAGWPGIYTRLSAHADWLRTHVAELEPGLAAASDRSTPASSADALGPAKGPTTPRKLLFANWSPKAFEPSVAGGLEFAERLKETSAGRLDIAHFFAGEIVAGGAATIDATTWANIEMAWAAPAYNFRRSAAFAVLGNAVPFGMEAEQLAAWMRGEGGRLMQRLFDRYNIHALPCAIMGERGSGWFRKPLADAADLKGLKINAGDFYGSILARAGALPQRVNVSEVWHALQDGRLDAAIFQTPETDEKLRYHQVAPYYYYPGWHYRNTLIALLISDRTWAALGDRDKALIEQACDESIDRTMARSKEHDQEVIARLVSAGAQLQQLPPAAEFVLRKATDDFFAEEAAIDPDFAAALESYRRHQTASPILTHTLPKRTNSVMTTPVTPSLSPVAPPPAQAQKARSDRAARKKRKQEAQGQSWREEAFRPN